MHESDVSMTQVQLLHSGVKNHIHVLQHTSRATLTFIGFLSVYP